MLPPPDTPSGGGGGGGSATARTAIVTLINSAVGVGVLSFPFAFRCAGYVGGLLALAAIASAEAFTLYVLSRYAEATGADSYAAVARGTLGPGAGVALAVVLLTYLFGSCCAYLIILADCLQPIAADALERLGLDAARYGSRTVVLTAASLLLVLPMSLAKTLEALKRPGQLALYGIGVMVGVIVWRDVGRVRDDPAGTVALVRPFPESFLAFFKALPIIIFGVQCHAQVVAVFNELEDRPRLLGRRTRASLVGWFGVLRGDDGNEGGIFSRFGSAARLGSLASTPRLLLLGNGGSGGSAGDSSSARGSAASGRATSGAESGAWTGGSSPSLSRFASGANSGAGSGGGVDSDRGSRGSDGYKGKGAGTGGGAGGVGGERGNGPWSAAGGAAAGAYAGAEDADSVGNDSAGGAAAPEPPPTSALARLARTLHGAGASAASSSPSSSRARARGASASSRRERGGRSRQDEPEDEDEGLGGLFDVAGSDSFGAPFGSEDLSFAFGAPSTLEEVERAADRGLYGILDADVGDADGRREAGDEKRHAGRGGKAAGGEGGAGRTAAGGAEAGSGGAAGPSGPPASGALPLSSASSTTAPSHAADACGLPSPPPPVSSTASPSLPAVSSLAAFSPTSTPRSPGPFFTRVRRHSRKLRGMRRVVFSALGLTAVGYALIGETGYAAFPRTAKSNILNNFAADDPVVQVARGLVGLMKLVSYPINLHPARSAVRDLLQQATGRPLDSELFHVSTTLLLFLPTLAVALSVRDLGLVFQIIGGTNGAALIFCLPGLMLMTYARQKAKASRAIRQEELEGGSSGPGLGPLPGSAGAGAPRRGAPWNALPTRGRVPGRSGASSAAATPRGSATAGKPHGHPFAPFPAPDQLQPGSASNATPSPAASLGRGRSVERAFEAAVERAAERSLSRSRSRSRRGGGELEQPLLPGTAAEGDDAWAEVYSVWTSKLWWTGLLCVLFSVFVCVLTIYTVFWE